MVSLIVVRLVTLRMLVYLELLQKKRKNLNKVFSAPPKKKKKSLNKVFSALLQIYSALPKSKKKRKRRRRSKTLFLEKDSKAS